MKTVREVFTQFISNDEELEEFAAWAFGKFYRELDQGMDFMNTWNYLHSDLLKLSADGVINDDAKKMVDVWKANKPQ